MKRSAAVLFLSLVAASVGAQTNVHPNIERGTGSGKRYDFNSIDTVNVFNGNLIIQIPIGGRLPVSSNLSYSLTLVYNSKVWEHERATDYSTDPPSPSSRTIPNRRSNAGLGWELSLGRLIDPQETDVLDDAYYFHYESADGSDHILYESLHDSDAATPGAFYTRDNTYLRLTTVPNSVNKQLEFPDGTIQEFEPWTDTLPPAPIGRWRLKQVRDRFGNHYDVNYTTTPVTLSGDGSQFNATVWTITDQHGRSTVVTFAPSAQTSYDIGIQQDNYKQVIASVDVPAFGGTTARFSFAYSNPNLPVPRGFCNTEVEHNLNNDNPSPILPLLTAISLPDGTQYAMTGGNGLPAYFTTGDSCASGQLNQITLPTQGKIQWTYRHYQLPVNKCDPEPLNESSGVLRRSFVDPYGVTCVPDGYGESPCKWTYKPALTPRAGDLVCLHQIIPGAAPEEATTTVTDPAGNDTVYYFSVYPGYANPSNDPPDGSTKLEYGLPFTRLAQDSGKYLSTQIFSGSAPSRTLQRSTYVKYERDSFTTTPRQFDANRRVAATRTVFNDDGNNSVDTDSPVGANGVRDFDGLGHYRTTTRTTTFAGSSSSSQSSRINYNVAEAAVNPSALATGTYGPDSATNTFVIPPADARWILNLYSSTTVTEGTATATRQFCFSPTTGFLNATRTLRGPAIDATDLLTVFADACEADDPGCIPDGNVRRERFYGGDTKPLAGAGSLCTLIDSPGPLGYDLRHRYQFGVQRQSAYYSGTTPLSFKTLDNTIDRNSGLVASSRDTAGIATTYSYDASRRMTGVSAAALAPVSFTYSPATPSMPATITTNQTSAAAGSVSSQVQLDFLGRTWRESTLMPGGTWSVRQYHYDASGRQDWVSLPESSGTLPPSVAFAPGHKTSYSDFDVFGRAHTVTPPDSSTGQDKRITFSYSGTRVIERTKRVNSNSMASTTREEYDGFGRLYRVTEPGMDGTLTTPNSTTTYRYDVMNRLWQADMVSARGVTQTRRSCYDYRGLLQWEQDPETGVTVYGLGVPANLTSCTADVIGGYQTSYDARGHATAKSLNNTHDIYDLLFAFDPAERLTEIDSRNPYYPNAPEYRVSKEFQYGSTAGTLSNGKLLTAVRHNYHPETGDITVTETYEYGDSAGRLTKKTTEIQHAIAPPYDPFHQKLEQSYTYNDLGAPSQTTYPSCDIVLCGNNPGWNTIVSGYGGGHLHDVSGFATNIAYAASGAVNSIQHANGVLDTINPDPNGFPRPASITFSGTTACTPPILTAPDQSVPFGSTATLTASASGTPPLEFQWYTDDTSPIDANKIAGATNPTYTTPAITGTNQFWVVAANSCGQAQRMVTVRPILIAPTSLVATASGTAAVTIGWNSTACSHYEVERRSNGSAFARIATPTAAIYTDQSVSADMTYVYRVRAVDDSYPPAASAYSNVDLATTIVFSAVAPGGDVLAAHWTELLNGLNAVRAASGAAAVGWAEILPAGTPVPASELDIYAAHVTALRSAMDSARQALGLSALAYTDPNLESSSDVRAVHVTDLQDRIR